MSDAVALSKASAEFQKAVADVKTLAKMPCQDDQLELYKYYKQVLEGDAPESAPSFLSGGLTGKPKWAARNEIRGMSTEEAEKKYIDIVARLLAAQ